MAASTDWTAWSRDAVALMQARNDGWIARLGLSGAPYHWDLDGATMTFDRGGDMVVADICVVGTASVTTGTFLWSWANDAIPAAARGRIEAVRAFGHEHDLSLLTMPEWEGGRAEGLEMLAVAGRALDADGVWIDTAGDVTLFFLLTRFRPTSKDLLPPNVA